MHETLNRIARHADYEDSRYSWVPTAEALTPARGSFTYESKLRLYHRAIDDLNHSSILRPTRPLFNSKINQTLDEENRRNLEKVRAATIKEANN